MSKINKIKNFLIPIAALHLLSAGVFAGGQSSYTAAQGGALIAPQWLLVHYKFRNSKQINFRTETYNVDETHQCPKNNLFCLLHLSRPIQEIYPIRCARISNESLSTIRNNFRPYTNNALHQEFKLTATDEEDRTREFGLIDQTNVLEDKSDQKLAVLYSPNNKNIFVISEEIYAWINEHLSPENSSELLLTENTTAPIPISIDIPDSEERERPSSTEPQLPDTSNDAALAAALAHEGEEIPSPTAEPEVWNENVFEEIPALCIPKVNHSEGFNPKVLTFLESRRQGYHQHEDLILLVHNPQTNRWSVPMEPVKARERFADACVRTVSQAMIPSGKKWNIDTDTICKAKYGVTDPSCEETWHFVCLLNVNHIDIQNSNYYWMNKEVFWNLAAYIRYTIRGENSPHVHAEVIDRNNGIINKVEDAFYLGLNGTPFTFDEEFSKMLASDELAYLFKHSPSNRLENQIAGTLHQAGKQIQGCTQQ